MEVLLNTKQKVSIKKISPIFQVLTAIPKIEYSNKNTIEKKKSLSIEFYQTTAFVTYLHHKPISKIFLLND